MDRTVNPGHTFVAHGTLHAGNTLTAAAGLNGGPGGFIEVTNSATNLGSVVLQGGLSGQAGASVDIGVGASVFNDGSVLIESGRYSLGEGAGQGASVSQEGLVYNAGTIQLGDNGSGGGATLRIGSSGTLDNNNLLSISGGVYNNATGGPGTVAGATLVVGGYLDNTGTLSAQGGAPSYGSDSLGAYISAAGVISNAGTILLQGGRSAYGYSFGPGFGATLALSGNLLNSGTIEIRAATDSIYRGAVGASGGQLTNTGVLTNQGVINVEGGVNLNGGNPPAGTLATSGQFTNDGTLTAMGGGSIFYVDGGLGGVVDFSGGSALNNGLLIAAGGLDSINELRFSAGGTIAVSGSLCSYGTMQVQGGQYGMDVGIDTGYGGLGGQLVDGGTLTNTGLLSIGAGLGAGTGQGLGGTATVSGTLVNAGTISISAGNGNGTDGTLDITATGTLIDAGGTVIGAGLLSNAGLIEATGSAGGIDGARVVNDGMLRVGTGAAFTITGALAASIGASGAISIGAHADLTLFGAVAASQSISFAGADATLTLADTAAFAGVLEGLAGSDTIDLLGLHALSAVTSGTGLSVALQGGASLHLTLGGNLGADTTMSLASDGHGGTDLLFRPG